MLVPVVFVLCVYIEVIVVGVGLVPLVILQLHLETVLLGAGQQMDEIISCPVLSRGIPETLQRVRLVEEDKLNEGAYDSHRFRGYR